MRFLRSFSREIMTPSHTLFVHCMGYYEVGEDWQPEPFSAAPRTALQLYIYAVFFFLLGLACWTLGLSFFYCPPEVCKRSWHRHVSL